MSYMGVVGRILTPPPPNSDSLVYTLCMILFPECNGTCRRMGQGSRPEGAGRQKMHSHYPGRKQISVVKCLWRPCELQSVSGCSKWPLANS